MDRSGSTPPFAGTCPPLWWRDWCRRLDGADLSGSDLSFTSLKGASLRETDLRGSRLSGTDLRGTDLTDARLDRHALEQSHWTGAQGVSKEARSYAILHNAGVEAAQDERWPAAERLFSAAIDADPDEPLSWVARGISRGMQGKNELASSDFNYARSLFADKGDLVKADQLNEAIQRIHDNQNKDGNASRNGIGSALISGAISTVQTIVPFALKALMPAIP